LFELLLFRRGERRGRRREGRREGRGRREVQ
jgi:hypothetical protein